MNTSDEQTADAQAKDFEPLVDFTQSFDARDWARAFISIATANPEIPLDEGAMIGWFANAIMRGYDEHARYFPERA